MMLFKLSLKNIRKSFKDYAIYFLTLILGVAIFYVFNAIDSQQAMLEVSNSTRGIMKMMVTMLSGVSVVVALILGFLIIYANNFLIKRRKKEFAVYMMLGMGKQEVSQILFGETILIGLFSLCVGRMPHSEKKRSGFEVSYDITLEDIYEDISNWCGGTTWPRCNE